MEFAGCVQVVGVVAFMDADSLLLPVRTEKGLKTGGPFLGLGDAAVAIILAERVVSHANIIKRSASFCQMEKTGGKETAISRHDKAVTRYSLTASLAVWYQ